MRNRDRAADCATELVALDQVGGVGKIGASVEDWVTHELEEISVKLIRAAFRHHVDDAAGISAVARTVIARLNAEFLQRVGEWEWDIDVVVLVKERSAVKLIAGLVIARAVDVDIRRARRL